MARKRTTAIRPHEGTGIGRVIKRLCDDADMAVAEAERICGFAPGRLQSIVRGSVKDGRSDTLQTFAALFGLTAEDIRAEARGGKIAKPLTIWLPLGDNIGRDIGIVTTKQDIKQGKHPKVSVHLRPEWAGLKLIPRTVVDFEMEPLYPPGTRVICTPFSEFPHPLPSGQFVIVEHVRDGVTTLHCRKVMDLAGRRWLAGIGGADQVEPMPWPEPNDRSAPGDRVTVIDVVLESTAPHFKFPGS